MNRSSVRSPAWHRDPVLWWCLLVGALFLFVRLGQILLWQDEAETAVLARNILRFGYPRAFDGVNLVWLPGVHRADFAWAYHPWASFYLTAASFKMFGVTTWAARAPFALLGWLGLLLTYLLAREVSGRLSVRRWAIVSLLLCVPFLLYMRQCRYYAPTVTLTLAWLLAYWAWLQGRRGATSWMIAVGALFFHTNHGAALPTAGALFLDWWWSHRRAASWRRTARVVLPIALLTAPWFWCVHDYNHAAGDWSFHRLRQHAEFYLRMTNKHVLPLAAWGLFLLWRWLRRRRLVWNGEALRIDRAKVRTLLFLLAVTMGFLLLPEQRHVRYLVGLLPIWLLLQALLLDDWVRHRRWAGMAVAALVLGTNVFTGARWRVPLADFAYELTHDYHGPNAAIVNYLNAHARPGERVKTPYDDRVLIFYTRLAVDPPNAVGPSNPFARETFPEWIVPRTGWLRADFWSTPYGQRIRQEYGEIRLAAVDLLWDNLPDPNEHHFRTVDGPPVVIYRRSRTIPAGR